MPSVSEKLREIDSFLANAKKDEEFAKLNRKLISLECQCRELDSKLKEIIKDQQSKSDTIRHLRRQNNEQIDKVGDLKQTNRDLRWRIHELQSENQILKKVLFGKMWSKCRPGESFSYKPESSKESSDENVLSNENEMSLFDNQNRHIF